MFTFSIPIVSECVNHLLSEILCLYLQSFNYHRSMFSGIIMWFSVYNEV